MGDQILVSVTDGIATVTFNRPSQRNAMNHGMWVALGNICHDLDSDPSVRVVVLTGAGNEAFSAGADIKEFDELRADSTQARGFARAVDGALEALSDLSKPTIAKIKGYCVGGGCELACAADIRIAAENARFGVPAARLGISVGYKEMRGLVRLVGPGNASFILLSSRLLDAHEALRINLVNHVASLAESDEYVHKLAQDMAELAPLAHRDNKEIMRTVLANPALEGLTPEQQALPFRVFDTEDYREGRCAFVERRPPKFNGR